MAVVMHLALPATVIPKIPTMGEEEVTAVLGEVRQWITLESALMRMRGDHLSGGMEWQTVADTVNKGIDIVCLWDVLLLLVCCMEGSVRSTEGA